MGIFYTLLLLKMFVNSKIFKDRYIALDTGLATYILQKKSRETRIIQPFEIHFDLFMEHMYNLESSLCLYQFPELLKNKLN